jgi:hypothetical protein
MLAEQAPHAYTKLRLLWLFNLLIAVICCTFLTLHSTWVFGR